MTGSYATLYFHFEDFTNIVDLLRNEKPMKLYYPTPGDSFGPYIGTENEPVGEGEL